MNLALLPLRHAETQPERIAVIQQREKISYREFRDRLAAAAAGLRETGIEPGDRVGICLGDHADHLVSYFAVAAVGGTVVPLDHRWTQPEKTQVAAAFGVARVIREGNDPGIEGVENIPLPALSCGAIPQAELVAEDLAAGEGRPFIVALSSGTTGRPKGALVTHQQMLERFNNQEAALNFSSSDRFLSVTPLYFGAARSLCMGFISLGATVVIDPPPHKPPQLAAAIQTSSANIVFLVPTLMHRLLPLADENGPLFPGLELLVFGGSIVRREEALEMRRKLTPNMAGYYATSEGGGISVLHAAEFDKWGDTVGKAAAQVTVEVVDDNNAVLPPGETGRLRYRGPGVATNFLDEHGDPDATSVDGWFYPGDLASLDENGYISLRGREKEVIIRGGVNVYPAEIETVLREHPAVTEAAVLGLASETMGEDITAFVVGEDTLTGAELLEHCRKQLAPYKVPRQVLVIDDMPKTNFGKLDKKTLAARLR